MAHNNRKILSSDIRYACSDTYYDRGKKYVAQGRVLDVQIEQDLPNEVSFRSIAQGSGSKQYTQEIDIFWDQKYSDVSIEGFCTCPVGYNCKHVAAACLYYMQLMAGNVEAQKHGADCLAWLDKLDQEQGMETDYEREFVAYVIEPMPRNESGYQFSLYGTRLGKQGNFLKGKKLAPYGYGYGVTSYNQDAVDRDLVRLSIAMQTGFNGLSLIQGTTGYMAVVKALHAGRLFWGTHQSEPLHQGNELSLSLEWTTQTNGNYKAVIAGRENKIFLQTDPILYVDPEQGAVGLVDMQGVNKTQLSKMFDIPEIPPTQVDEFSRRLLQEHPSISIPPPKPIEIIELKGVDPVPHLRLFGGEYGTDLYAHFAQLSFDYAEHRLSTPEPEPSTLIHQEQGYCRVHRNFDAESVWVEQLFKYGLFMTEPGFFDTLVYFFPVESIMESASLWSDFLEKVIPELIEQGWTVDQDDSFQLRFEQAGDWHADIEPSGNDWFSMHFNVDIGGQSMPLLPLLAPVLEYYDLDALPEMLSIPLDQHRFVNVPSAQFRPFLDILHELFDSMSFDADGNARLSRFNAAALADLEEHSYGLFSVNGGEELREIGRKLRDFSGIAVSELPVGLQAELRDYQHKGLSWLQFLREFRFAGILADDMGLGKTVQTLAHLLLEKESGRMDKPCLIVAPTSLMGNWRREAEKFTPALKVLTLQGTERKQNFDSIAEHDLILTTYPLLPRDSEYLLAHEYYYLLLDEAQVIKNPKAQAARIAREINANHRLCLTGTPMENHLGELWAQFDFLMPGFLGNSELFKKLYRTPIEVHGDDQQRARLSKRLQPFMLRRTKQQVIDELPEKTEIIRSVPLHDKQAALYESIRVSMEKKVRDAIAEKGLARSHITILDALLKLRQTCCDPRTLSLKEAQKIKQSAKLDLLMELLPEMLEEGRRILVFSQFTRMLALIETELNQAKISYTKLTGQTRKRDEAIEKFKSGEADVFLISLKAGGVGLNLTEADTVIIYDPWWNPAVESQAADRAHRIGQDKAVFVYKLVTENTVEEKILALQEKKRALAEGLYQGGKKDDSLQFNADDLSDLFKPLG